MSDAAARLLIAGGLVVDGTGAAPTHRDVLVDRGVIAAVEDPRTLESADAQRVDATGLALAPGFIDVHSHADNAPLLQEDDTSKILQGVTTEVVGNCGFSLAPHSEITGGLLEAYSRRIFPPVEWQWRTFAELFATTDARGYVTNYAPLIGHHALRVAALGMSDAAPSTSETEAMVRALREGFDAGAFGLSSGLIYPPGLFAGTDELCTLASQLPEGRLYATHMRGEGVQLERSVAEAVAVAESAGCRLQISHLKSAGRQNWGRLKRVLATLDEARDRDVDVRQDAYPYVAGSTMLTATLPPWFQEGGDESVLGRLEDERCLERLRRGLQAEDPSWENHIFGAGWEGIVLASTATHQDEGFSLAALAEKQGREPFDVLVDVLLRERLQVSMIVFSIAEPDLVDALADPYTMIGSDGLPPGVGGKPHPRMYGTFPRVLARYVREQGVLTLEEAIRRMTALPSETFGIPDRGRIEPGLVADLVAFDPKVIRDAATYDQPTAPPDGIKWVMQAGRVSVQDGQLVAGRQGMRLLPAH